VVAGGLSRLEIPDIRPDYWGHLPGIPHFRSGPFVRNSGFPIRAIRPEFRISDPGHSPGIPDFRSGPFVRNSGFPIRAIRPEFRISDPGHSPGIPDFRPDYPGPLPGIPDFGRKVWAIRSEFRSTVQSWQDFELDRENTSSDIAVHARNSFLWSSGDRSVRVFRAY